MGYPDASNPRHVRSMIENVYANYASGQDMFPKGRIRVGVESLPRKTQRIAATLEHAWAVIDEDREFFGKAVLEAYDMIEVSDDDDKNGLVITCVGRNAVKLALISILPEPTVEISVWPRQEFVEQFEGHEFALRGGGSVTLRDGKAEGPFGGMVIRRSNSSGVFGVSPDETRALVAAVGTTPVQIVDMSV